MAIRKPMEASADTFMKDLILFNNKYSSKFKNNKIIC